MAKCLLCFSEAIGSITDEPDSEWGCFDCGAFGPSEDDISSPCVDLERAHRHGQVYRAITDDPEDVFVAGWA